MKEFLGVILVACSSLCYAEAPQVESSLFEDLSLIASIDRQIHDRLPFFYNNSFVGGYFNMPSARMSKAGLAAFGGGSVPPYSVYGLNFQVFDHIELSANYRVFNGIMEKNFGHAGFGDDAERIGNIKIAFHLPEDGFPIIPNFAIGANDFIGTKRFNAQYVVATQQWLDYNIECTLGWAKGYVKGVFGGVAWTPLRKTNWKILKDISLLAEYDATNYKKHPHEHPDGRKVKTRINGGIAFVGWDSVQVAVSSVRGEKIAGTASFRYPIGTSKGLFPKVADAAAYRSPVDTEPMGILRPEKEFAQELAYAFGDQGLDLFSAYLTYDPQHNKELWLKVVNNRYRDEGALRERLEHLLSALTPSDIPTVMVIIEADALPCQAYRFRTQDLNRYRLGTVGEFEMETLGPMREVPEIPGIYDSTLLFRRKKRIWTFTIRPRFLSFFGSSQGKFKYDYGLIAAPEGYILDQLYYKFQVGYSIQSSFSDLGASDILNPSHLFNVRTDSIKYFKTNTVSLEQAFIQKGWNAKKGFFFRLATGYFEPAYAGFAGETLFYPVDSNWAVGLEAATVWKRRYQGVKFQHKVRKVEGHTPEYKPFIGIQYFLDIYYNFKPLDIEVKVSGGQFLAKDFGIRTEVSRYFPSGMKFGLWYTVTNAHDKVNGRTYFDKGFAFSMPLDFFLKQSSRNYVAYAMAAWLRDSGAKALTGKQLYTTLNEERYYKDSNF